MLIFAGLEEDKIDERAAKLKALQNYYHETNPRPWNMLGATDLAPSNKDRGKQLIVNSHGNRTSFADMDANKFYSKLVEKGFQDGSFEALYLMACKVGQQDQRGVILENFARDLFGLLRAKGVNLKLYAPRGTLTYEVKTETKLGQSYYVVTNMYIESPERNYPLAEGMLLLNAS
jgi:hypothetical protein